MRAAAAEVEDYTRIRVTSRTSAALAGHAVADIIHLLAELVENAATFSPTNTPVRVDGEKVARGVVVEIEDRGLGMGDDQLAQINQTLSDPPLFDLSGSDQLGLFIAGQLGQRHDVKVTLRGSAYGGITAVVLIPADLIVDIDEQEGSPAIAGIRELGGRPVPELPGPPAEQTRTLAASAAATASSAQVIDIDPGLPGSDHRLTGMPDLPTRTREPDPWTTAASFDPGVAAPEMPAWQVTEQQAQTGLGWENAVSAWADGAGHGWSANGAGGWDSAAAGPGGGQQAVAPDLAGTDFGAVPGSTNGSEAEPAEPADLVTTGSSLGGLTPPDAWLTGLMPPDTGLATSDTESAAPVSRHGQPTPSQPTPGQPTPPRLTPGWPASRRPALTWPSPRRPLPGRRAATWPSSTGCRYAYGRLTSRLSYCSRTPVPPA